jgi:ferredoxin
VTSRTEPTPEIAADYCKGCERCIVACPEHALVLSEALNSKGFRYVRYAGDGCTGCGACFYNCPEPEAIQVFRQTMAAEQKGCPK